MAGIWIYFTCDTEWVEIGCLFMTKGRDSKSDRLFIFLQSKNKFHHEAAFRIVDVNIHFSEQDWETVVGDAAKLGYNAEDLLKRRLKYTIHTGNPMSRIGRASDRRRLMDGQAEFWEPVVKYLIYAHLTVLVASAIVDALFHFGRDYIVYYYVYLISLMFALVAFGGLKLKGLWEAHDMSRSPDAFGRAELFIARVSELLMWTSFIMLVSAVVVRGATLVHRFLSST